MTTPASAALHRVTFHDFDVERLLSGPTRLLMATDSDDRCVCHLWWFVDSVSCRGRKGSVGTFLPPGLVHDMVTDAAYRRRGLLRTLVHWAREVSPAGEAPYCTDESLTVLGGPAAVRLGLISPDSYLPDRPGRKRYEELGQRTDGHLLHEMGLPQRSGPRGRRPDMMLASLAGYIE